MATYESLDGTQNSTQSGSSTYSASQVTGLPMLVTMEDDKGQPMYPKTSMGGVVGVLPIRKGGTGIQELVGGKLMASSQDKVSLEEIDVGVDMFAGLKENIQKQFDKTRTYALTIPSSPNDWETLESGGFKQSFNLIGITAKDNPIVGFLPTSTDVDEIKEERIAYGCLSEIITRDGTVDVYCYGSTPAKSFSISLHCTGE